MTKRRIEWKGVFPYVCLCTLWQVVTPLLLRVSHAYSLRMAKAAEVDAQALDTLRKQARAVSHGCMNGPQAAENVLFWCLFALLVLVGLYVKGIKQTVVTVGLSISVSIGAAWAITPLCAWGMDAFSYGVVMDLTANTAVGAVLATALALVLHRFLPKVTNETRKRVGISACAIAGSSAWFLVGIRFLWQGSQLGNRMAAYMQADMEIPEKLQQTYSAMYQRWSAVFLMADNQVFWLVVVLLLLAGYFRFGGRWTLLTAAGSVGVSFGLVRLILAFVIPGFNQSGYVHVMLMQTAVNGALAILLASVVYLILKKKWLRNRQMAP